MTKMQMYLVFSILLTRLPALVTALPLLTGDNVAETSKNDAKVAQYLVKYGHLDRKDDERNALLSQEEGAASSAQPNLHTKDEISNGIKSFQNSFGLKVTGELNEDTVKLMNTPRCGMSDKMATPHHRVRRYNIWYKGRTFKWLRTRLTWHIDKYYYGKISHAKQEEIFDRAFKVWERGSPLLLAKSTKGYGEISIYFVKGYHYMDASPFDGPGGTLAHAFLPVSSRPGDIHFDEEEPWTENMMYQVALHEIGHVLGLFHSYIYDSVMYPHYIGKPLATRLHEDDQDGIDALYGPCKTKIDGVIYNEDSYDILFIRKDLVWRWDGTSNRVKDGYPRKINSEFPSRGRMKIPSDLDCASSYKYTRTKYIFAKGNLVYHYDPKYKRLTVKTLNQYFVNKHREPNYRKIPIKIDACASMQLHPMSTWVIKGNLTWEFDDWDGERSVLPNNPRELPWHGVPLGVDDGFFKQDPTLDAYFFKGTQYWHATVYDWPDQYKAPNRPTFTPGGFIHEKWPGICSAKY